MHFFQIILSTLEIPPVVAHRFRRRTSRMKWNLKSLYVTPSRVPTMKQTNTKILASLVALGIVLAVGLIASGTRAANE